MLTREASGTVFSRFSTHLLPMACPEGSPSHPSRPAGPATISVARTTGSVASIDRRPLIV